MGRLISAFDKSASSDETSSPETETTGARILVVDDDKEMRELVATRLLAQGYSVHGATTGSELLRVLEDVSVYMWPLDGIDLIVVDNRMPGITGLEAIRRLRLAQWDTPAVLITAFPDDEVLREAARLKVPVLPKPFSLELLTHAVLSGILGRPLERQSHVARVPS